MNNTEARVAAATGAASDDGVSSSSALLSASSHYRGGRFALAASAFREGCSDDSYHHHHRRPSRAHHERGNGCGASSSTVGRGDDPLLPSSLHRLASDADAALCKLRAFESSSDRGHPSRSDGSNNKYTSHHRSLAEDALGANVAYRDALRQATTALLQRVDSRGQSRSRRSQSRRRRSRKIRTMMIRQIASSTMAAGVSACWIHLRIGDVASARHVLRESARVAASTLLVTPSLHGNHDGGAHAHDGWNPSSLTMTMTVEEALCHLDHHGPGGEDEADFGEEFDDGRLAEAVRSLRHSMRVVDLCLDSSSDRAGVAIGTAMADDDSIATMANNHVDDVDVDQNGRKLGRKKVDGGGSPASPAEGPWSPESVARELLVDALCLNSHEVHDTQEGQLLSPSSKDSSSRPSVGGRRERIRRRRDELLRRAVTVDPTYRPAKRMKVLFEGRRQLIEEARRCDGGDEGPTVPPLPSASASPDEVLRSLEALARDEGYRPAADLLGCLRARRGEYPEALSAFQSALELVAGESAVASRGLGGTRPDEEGRQDDEGDEAISRDNWETISNMALCFSALGEPRPAVELLLLLLTAPERKKNNRRQRGGGREAAAIARSTRPASLRIITGDGMAQPPREPPDRTTLLWRLFHASSHVADHVTCEAATEELELELELATRCNGAGDGTCGAVTADGVPPSVLCARVFALLQDRRPSAALRVMLRRRRRDEDYSREPGCPVEALLRLYEADARVGSGEGLRHEEDDGESDSFEQSTADARGGDGDRNKIGPDEASSGRLPAVLALSQRAFDDLAKLSSSATAPLPSDASLGRLDVAARNNLGVAHVLAGRGGRGGGASEGRAMRCFEEAALAATRLPPSPDGCVHHEGGDDSASDHTPRSSSSSPSTLSFLPAHFNLALLLWSRGHADGAARVWLTTRGIGREWDDASSGKGGTTTGAGRTLRDALEKAISRHGLLLAGGIRNEQIWDDTGDHVSPWCADGAAGRVGVIDEVQVAAMDVTILKHAVAVGRRKASLLFKRGGGLMKEDIARNR